MSVIRQSLCILAMNKNRFILLVALVVSFSSAAQQNNIWYFGQKGGLDFNPVPGLPSPVAIGNSAMAANEGCGSICDINGQLLFYSNGITVYNRQHQVMLNGDNLDGHISSVQSCIIVPKPGNAFIYYIFTSDALENNFTKGYCYSVVDMQGDNGNGAVVSKNNLLLAPGTERLTAVRHADGLSVWVITNDNSSNTFRAWLINCNGLQAAPVVSNVGVVLDQDAIENVGMMKASPDGKQLCQTHFSDVANAPVFVQLFDFDNATGILSNPRSIGFAGAQFSTCEYSPDSKLLYLARTFDKAIDQLEVTLPTLAGILASRVTINTGTANFMGIQLAPDGKIYLARQSIYLGAINLPNKKGQGCNYKEEQIQLKNGASYVGLPAYINDLSYDPNNGFTYTILDSCSGTIQFQGVTTLAAPVQWSWDFDDGNTSNMQNPIHTFNPANKDYLVRINISSTLSCGSITLSKTINPRGIVTNVDFDYVADCDSGYVRFINKFPELQGTMGQYSWDFGDGTISTAVNPIHTYGQPGSYPVKLKLTTSTSCLDDSLTITVTMPNLPVTISPDQTIFIGQKIQLFVNGAGNSYQWSPATGLSSTTVARPLASPVQDITYKATVINDNGCSGEDSVHITVVELDGIYVPTAFTPNNDGRNDDIRPYFGTKFTLKEFSIFSRWGERIFTTSTRDEGWKGKINGVEQNSGVYAWILRYIDDKGKSKEKKGTVILVR
ncbi:MAG TPA: PKD domain-containing protein [Chitinophagaceae bacterium]|nr:PKD domain-containing protein [Chitinophagaceae bacterium]